MSQFLYPPPPPPPGPGAAAAGPHGPPQPSGVTGPDPMASPPPAHVGAYMDKGNCFDDCKKQYYSTSSCGFQSLFLLSLGLVAAAASPLYSLPHTQYPYSMLGDQLAAW